MAAADFSHFHLELNAGIEYETWASSEDERWSHSIYWDNCEIRKSLSSGLYNASKARFRRRTSHEPYPALTRESEEFLSYVFNIFNAAHVK